MTAAVQSESTRRATETVAPPPRPGRSPALELVCSNRNGALGAALHPVGRHDGHMADTNNMFYGP